MCVTNKLNLFSMLPKNKKNTQKKTKTKMIQTVSMTAFKALISSVFVLTLSVNSLIFCKYFSISSLNCFSIPSNYFISIIFLVFFIFIFIFIFFTIFHLNLNFGKKTSILRQNPIHLQTTHHFYANQNKPTLCKTIKQAWHIKHPTNCISNTHTHPHTPTHTNTYTNTHNKPNKPKKIKQNKTSAILCFNWVIWSSFSLFDTSDFSNLSFHSAISCFCFSISAFNFFSLSCN